MKVFINERATSGSAPDGELMRRIENERVVAFRLGKENKTVLIEECCDGYFGVELTPAEFDRLLVELNKLRAGLDVRSIREAAGKTKRKRDGAPA